ncbi:MAG TPA: hypothetical protein IAA32_02320, partial [Candidatus Butyricicoccus stercorigallinarum]|nr:hypothetical protein [Candidatus Butyricicoccus stercorigallinarum]
TREAFVPHLQNSALQGRQVLYLHNSGFQRRFLCRVYKAIPFPPDKAKARTCFVRAYGCAPVQERKDRFFCPAFLFAKKSGREG